LQKYLECKNEKGERRKMLAAPGMSQRKSGPSLLETTPLEKQPQRALMRLFHDGEAPASLRKLKPPKDDEWGSKGEDAVYLSKVCRLLAKMKPNDQQFLLHMAQKAARG
jgi:hypothetical protein